MDVITHRTKLPTQSRIMNVFIFILTLIPLITFGQKVERTSVDSFSYSDGSFYYRLDLFDDSTFTYKHSFKLGSTTSNGKWRFNNDTLVLSNYEKPWTISSVEEKFIDTLKNTSMIDIKVNETSTLTLRRDSVNFYIDGELTIEKYYFSNAEYMVNNFDVWINGDCQNKRRSNEKGMITFEKDSISQISIDYHDYQVQGIGSNYFVVTLDQFPILLSPPTLKWTKWKINNNELIPMECGQLLEYIKLKK
jgi:hypothetical protein